MSVLVDLYRSPGLSRLGAAVLYPVSVLVGYSVYLGKTLIEARMLLGTLSAKFLLFWPLLGPLPAK